MPRTSIYSCDSIAASSNSCQIKQAVRLTQMRPHQLPKSFERLLQGALQLHGSTVRCLMPPPQKKRKKISPHIHTSCIRVRSIHESPLSQCTLMFIGECARARINSAVAPAFPGIFVRPFMFPQRTRARGLLRLRSVLCAVTLSLFLFVSLSVIFPNNLSEFQCMVAKECTFCFQLA